MSLVTQHGLAAICVPKEPQWDYGPGKCHVHCHPGPAGAGARDCPSQPCQGESWDPASSVLSRRAENRRPLCRGLRSTQATQQLLRHGPSPEGKCPLPTPNTENGICSAKHTRPLEKAGTRVSL